MGGKKKANTSKNWSLAGVPVYSTPLSLSEERAFKEPISSLRYATAQMRKNTPDTFQNGEAMKQGEKAARASLGFFFKYFEGKYQRQDIASALAKAAALPGPIVPLQLVQLLHAGCGAVAAGLCGEGRALGRARSSSAGRA